MNLITYSAITKKNINILLITILVPFRILIDLIWFHDKPSSIILIYSLIVLFFILNNFVLLLQRKSLSIILYLLIVMVIGSSVSYYFKGTISFQTNQILKNVFPALFLLLASEINIDFREIRKKLRTPVIYILVIGICSIFVQYDIRPKEIYAFFYLNPNHVVSQTIAKIFFLYLNNIYIISIICFSLFLLNVRSNLIPILLIYTTEFIKFKKSVVAKILFTIIITAICYYIYDNLDDTISRLLYRGRSQDAHSLSSGRFQIYSQYVSYITNNFSLFEWIFGVGYLNQLDNTITHVGHNDILNILCQYGVLGILFFSITYYQIQKKIDQQFRKWIILYFLFVALTNGIIFHQSNLILALYFKGTRKTINPKVIQT